VTLGFVASRLQDALENSGYFDLSYLPAPHGFALLTRLERIKPDGHPEVNDRFNVSTDLTSGFSLVGLVKALLTANTGYYRIIAFIVTPIEVQESSSQIDSNQLAAIANRGGDYLARTAASLPYDARRGYHCDALIYEFAKTSGRPNANLVQPSPVQGRDHLALAGVWQALAR
jgi:hypothetical protein